jgi:hypothetical protein
LKKDDFRKLIAEMLFFASLTTLDREKNIDFITYRIADYLTLEREARNQLMIDWLQPCCFLLAEDFSDRGSVGGETRYLIRTSLDARRCILPENVGTTSDITGEAEQRISLIWVAAIRMLSEDWQIDTANNITELPGFLAMAGSLPQIQALAWFELANLIVRAGGLGRSDITLKLGFEAHRIIKRRVAWPTDWQVKDCIRNALSGATAEIRKSTSQKAASITKLRAGESSGRPRQLEMFLPNADQTIDFPFALLPTDVAPGSAPEFPDLISYLYDDRYTADRRWDYFQAFHGDRRIDRIKRSGKERADFLLRAAAKGKVEMQAVADELSILCSLGMVHPKISRVITQAKKGDYARLKLRLKQYFDDPWAPIDCDLSEFISRSKGEWADYEKALREQYVAKAAFNAQIANKHLRSRLGSNLKNDLIYREEYLKRCLEFAPNVPLLVAQFDIWSWVMKHSVALKRAKRIGEAIEWMELAISLPPIWLDRFPPSERAVFDKRLQSYKMLASQAPKVAKREA